METSSSDDSGGGAMHETESDTDAAAALLAAATGGCAPELAQKLMLQVTDTLGLSGDPERAADNAMKIAAALQAMAAAAPRDPLEAMLAAQMAAVHEAAMRAMRRAAECTAWPEIEARYARQAARMMGLFMRQTEALERRRARGARMEARQTVEDNASPPSPTPPPDDIGGGSHTPRPAGLLDAAGEGLDWREPDQIALSRPGGGGLGGGGTRQSRAKPHKRNGRRHGLNGTAPPG